MLCVNNGLDFVPLMVKWSESPLSICRIQWVDMQVRGEKDGEKGEKERTHPVITLLYVYCTYTVRVLYVYHESGEG